MLHEAKGNKMTTIATKVKSRFGVDAESMKRDILVMLLQYEDPDVAVQIAVDVIIEIAKECGPIDFWEIVREKLGCILKEDGYDCEEDGILEMDIDDDDWLEEEAEEM